MLCGLVLSVLDFPTRRSATVAHAIKACQGKRCNFELDLAAAVARRALYSSKICEKVVEAMPGKISRYLAQRCSQVTIVDHKSDPILA